MKIPTKDADGRVTVCADCIHLCPGGFWESGLVFEDTRRRYWRCNASAIDLLTGLGTVLCSAKNDGNCPDFQERFPKADDPDPALKSSRWFNCWWT